MYTSWSGTAPGLGAGVGVGVWPSMFVFPEGEGGGFEDAELPVCLSQSFFNLLNRLLEF
jgi:hypothetical protein